MATAKGDIGWQETDNSSGFLCVFDGGSVQIISADKDGSYPYVLEILNSDGNIIESFRSRGNDPWNDGDLAELYERARRSATSVDDVLDSIISELPNIPTPPSPKPEPEPEGFTDEPPF